MLGLATADDKTISLEGITRASQIIGQLGKPLGTVVNVKGKIRIAKLPDKNGRDEEVGRYLVISQIDDRKLDTPIELKIFSNMLLHAKDGDHIDTRGYERIMTHGRPIDVRKAVVQARQSELEYHLTCYIDIVEE